MLKISWIFGMSCCLLASLTPRPAQAALLASKPANGPTGYPAPVAVLAAADGKTVYVAEYAARQVAVVDLADGRLVRTMSVDLPPSGLALDAVQGRLYVTCEAPEGRVVALNLATGKKEFELATGHTPLSPALSPDGKTLWVCNRFNHQVTAYDTTTRRELARLPMPREPVAAALTPEGSLLVVANHLPAMRADGDWVAAAVSLVDATARRVITNLTLPNGSTSLRGIAVAPDGKYAYVTHNLGRYQLPTTQLERGWMNTSALTIVDLAARKLLATVLLDDVDLGAANPWGVVCTSDGKLLCVAHSGTHEVSVIDRRALHDKLSRLAAGEKLPGVSVTLEDAPNDLSFLFGLRRRVRLTGNGPRGLAIAGDRAVAAEYFSDSLSVVHLAADASPSAARQITLGPRVAPTQERQGEMNFNNAQFCFQQWQSCTSCHPDSRADALNWDLLNDGIGNPKNTKNMLLAHKTPPAMSLGIRDTAEMAVRSGLKYIQFAVRPEADAVAIDTYLKSLQPVPSPRLVKGELSRAARRGERVFKKAGRAECHAAPLFTDLKSYDIGTGQDMDKGKALDTPTLVEVWRTAPYLHAGRAATMEDVLTGCNPGDRHGATSKLSREDLADLVEYILSL
ncbi:MAG: cell surface protein [Kiritimatiellaeota bacterium]|nr:cell surface protein [Kiritimatiellota bacterium]